MGKDTAVADRVQRALMGDEQLGPAKKGLVNAAQSLAGQVNGRVDLLRLAQVASLDPASPAPHGRGSLQWVNEALSRAKLTGVAGGTRAAILVAKAALGDAQGCPLLPEGEPPVSPEPDAVTHQKRRDNVGAASVKAALDWDQRMPTWRTGIHANLLTLLDQALLPALQALHLHGASLDAQVQEGLTSLQRRLGRVESATAVSWETQTLWWAQALYSKSLRRSYRTVEGAARVFWMAHDLAADAPACRRESLEAFFVETLRRLEDRVDDARPSDAWVKDLFDVMENAESVQLSPRLANVVANDPTLLPVTLLIAKRSRRVVSDVVRLLPEQMTLAEWAVQVFRERQLEQWLQAEAA